ncbi:unnamed protein product [Bemisia tabaci]|uniref:Uncharacterized protein n=2 Tax=Bemisia tabaci TaxID=7038 RepID=A0A9P0F8G6_BEMTA|nr:unnamed protein product [Bemisia tabaci]
MFDKILESNQRMQGMTNFLHDLKNENCKAEPKQPSTTSRSRRKSRWKLKFHHQALPPEYLDHYEASLSKQTLANAAAMKAKSASNSSSSSSSSGPMGVGGVKMMSTKKPDSCQVRYTDLPYMGEMTLDNARPRRGRKPKKADICHLIYKNYGTTILDEEPLNLCLRDLNHSNSTAPSKVHPQPNPVKPCDIYNGINLSPGMRNFPGFHIPEPQSTGPCPSNNEVSMCKFKFTGGPVPILQEKKMLSVDFTGNLKYSLGNSEPFKCNQNRFVNNVTTPSVNNTSMNINKRKSRKSLAREKLEKTFKEKGFLIQTQQLESDQGATYCKFRQLRKFTRYLFRSWKHHLPGEVMDNTTPLNTDPT